MQRRRNSLETIFPNVNFIKDNTLFINGYGKGRNRFLSNEDMEFNLVFQDSFKMCDRQDFDLGEFIPNDNLKRRRGDDERYLSDLEMFLG
jgi:hypothetical protein